MKHSFVIDQQSLLSVLSSMQPICTKRTMLDATASILFQVGHKELILKSTDLEISLQYSCPLAESSVTETITFLVQGKRIFEVVKELQGQIAFSYNGQQLNLSAGSVHLSLNIKDAQEFPPFPERIENLMQLDSGYFLSMLSKVAFLIPQNNANPALNGMLLEVSNKEMVMTSTDGHCLAQVKDTKYALDEARSWLLPRRAIFEIKKILETTEDASVFVGVCSNQLVFSGESFNFFTKLLADPFPQYAAIMGKEGFSKAALNRNDFVKTLRRSACLLSGQFIATTFDFDVDRLKARISNKEVGALEENLPLSDFAGERLEIRFYAPYLLNGLQVLNDDKISFFLKNHSKPIIFESHEHEYTITYLVMPVSPTSA